MQAITIAIGQTGLSFFAQQFLATKITQLLQGLNPPQRTIGIDDFSYGDGSGGTYYITGMSVGLSNGSMSGYNPVYQNVLQGLSNGVAIFTLNFAAGGFTANYAWEESYNWEDIGYVGNIRYDHKGYTSKNYGYGPTFSGMAIQVVVQFAFNTQANAWQVTVQGTTGDATTQNPNIPSDSVLQNQSSGSCSFSSHVSDATATAIDSINFATPINNLISGILASIPGSGNLGDGILYDFSIGDSGLVFPNNDGIQMGVKGGASYKGTPFSGDTPPSLPLPTPLADSDQHHLNMYVSNYEIDALTWAYYEAGNLNAIVNATDLPDPNVLKVKTYVSYATALKPYASFAMQAQIVQNAAPVTSFQLVYQLTTAVMTTLQAQLPTSVYQLLSGLQGNNYVSQAAFESDLNGATIDPSYFPTIETAAESMGMVVTHDITYTLVIQNFQTPEPNIVFQITRVDILGNLALNINSNQAQTMQFKFFNATWVATFVSSTIPNFDGTVLDMVWGQAGEPEYETLLNQLGSTGVPIPIMQGLQFDFANAVLSVQQGYVSILANVLYKGS